MCLFLEGETGPVQQNIYQSVNGETLGNIVQSIGFDAEDRAYIISNNSNRLDIVNRNTFELIRRIESGLLFPRYFVEINGMGYISNWGDPINPDDDFIAVMDLTSFTITTTIPVGEGPEEMLYNGFNLYVNQQGGFGVNNKVTVIDPMANQVVTEIEVADKPNSLQLDSSGNLWVLSEGFEPFMGSPDPETQGGLAQINTANNTVVQNFEFSLGLHPNFLNIDRDTIYYFLDNGVFIANALDFLMPLEPSYLIDVPFLNNMIVQSGTLYGCNAGDFSGNGTIEIYAADTGELRTSLTVGIIPGNVYMN